MVRGKREGSLGLTTDSMTYVATPQKRLIHLMCYTGRTDDELKLELT